MLIYLILLNHIVLCCNTLLYNLLYITLYHSTIILKTMIHTTVVRTLLFTYFHLHTFSFERITLNMYSNLIYVLHLTYLNAIYVLSQVCILNTGVRISKYKGPIELHGDFGELVQQD
jgi:hypothetical protein